VPGRSGFGSTSHELLKALGPAPADGDALRSADVMRATEGLNEGTYTRGHQFLGSGVPMREINQITVPADVVLRSHPSGHSVPLVRKREERKNRHPYRNLMIGLLVALIATAVTGMALYYSYKMERDAGYQIVCTQVVLSKITQRDCVWRAGPR
jgi:hypothetical protein